MRYVDLWIVWLREDPSRLRRFPGGVYQAPEYMVGRLPERARCPRRRPRRLRPIPWWKAQALGRLLSIHRPNQRRKYQDQTQIGHRHLTI